MSTAVDALGASAPAANTSGFSSLSSGDFTKIILTELSKQDPLQPNDTNALLQQISSVRSIQSNMDLSSKLNTLVSQNEFASAATLVGKVVGGIDESFNRVIGTVKSLSRTADGTVLTLTTGERINASDLDEIKEAPTEGGH